MSDRLRNSDIFASFKEMWFLTVDIESFYPTVFLENSYQDGNTDSDAYWKNMTAATKQDSMTDIMTVR